ncbi:MAG: Gfo/Idh/MocA family oxidoreductase [Rectinemataceae bacterium]|jgi:predicted dehydrogenase
MESVRWGILSVSGHYALRVHQPLSSLSEARIAAIASRGAERAAEAAVRFGIPRSHGSYAELIADPEVEAVYIPLPNNLHAEWAIAALDAGKHVICEKPFAMDAAQARAMVAKAKEKGLLVMEALMYRFHPQWQRAREIIATGELGRLRAIHCWFSYDNTDPANIRNRPETGGGALYDIGCYAVSSARFLAAASPGSPKEPERGFFITERDAAFGTDTLGTGLLDFGQDGPRASFHISTQAFPVQRVEVMGESGSLAVMLPFNAYPDVPLTVEVTTDLGTRRIETGPADQYGLMFAAFSRAIRAKSPAPTPPEDGIANMAALDALFRSEKSGKWERI